MIEIDANASRRLGQALVRRLAPPSLAFVASLVVAMVALRVLAWLTFVSVPPVQLTLNQGPTANGSSPTSRWRSLRGSSGSDPA